MITLPSTARDALLLIARVLIGVVLIAHGWQKFVTYGIGGASAAFAPAWRATLVSPSCAIR